MEVLYVFNILMLTFHDHELSWDLRYLLPLKCCQERPAFERVPSIFFDIKYGRGLSLLIDYTVFSKKELK